LQVDIISVRHIAPAPSNEKGCILRSFGAALQQMLGQQ
jgi:hypothetical protein